MKPKAKLFDEERRQEILDSLPVVVSAIVTQKNDSSRVSIFADGTFFVGLQTTTSQNLGLRVGYEITADVLRKMESLSVHDGIRGWILNLLAKRMYSRSQLMKKCRESEFDPDVCRNILDEFESRNWINDLEFAKAYTSDKTRFSKWGPQKIRYQLKSVGVADAIIQQVITENITQEDQLEMALQSLEKRRFSILRVDNPMKRKKKAVDYLIAKGYDRNIVYSVADTYLNKLESWEN